jgi:hypothetical protein
MENREGYLEFISSENYKNQIDIWYRAYNVSREKTELFRDFLISLHELLDSTYLGSDILNREEDIIGHFTWCWDKTIENFSKEKIHFKNRGYHMDYFTTFYIEAFYSNPTQEKIQKIHEYLDLLFDFKHKKSKSELDMLTEIYKLFDQNLKK